MTPQVNNQANDFLTPISTSTDSKKLISNNIGDIQSELEIATKGTCAVTIHNFDIQKKLAKLIKFSVSIRDPNFINRNLNNGTASEQAKRLNELTSNHIVGNVVFDNVYDPAEVGVSFVDYETGQVKNVSKHFSAAAETCVCSNQQSFCW